MIFEYEGLHGCKAKCDIEFHNNNVVIATELYDNEGTSITNMAERLATKICNKFSIPLDELIWIEHYSDASYNHRLEETFDRIVFDIDKNGFSNPKWRRISKSEVEKLKEYRCNIKEPKIG